MRRSKLNIPEVQFTVKAKIFHIPSKCRADLRFPSFQSCVCLEQIAVFLFRYGLAYLHVPCIPSLST